MQMFEPFMQPLMYRFAKRKDTEDEEMRLFKSKKAAHNFYMFLWHIFSTCGLLYCVYDKPWLPRYMGGSGTFLAGFQNIPFSSMDRDAYFFGLIILGHPLQQSLTHFFSKER